MGSVSLPPSPHSITPEWLTREFHRSGTLHQANVVSVAVDPIAAGIGFAGQGAHLHIQYDRKEAAAPSVVYAKLSPADPEVRENLRSVGQFEAETGFYRDIATSQNLPFRVPHPYVSLYDHETAESIALIEDLGQARFGDQVVGLSPAEARTVVRQLARMHAHFWQAPKLENLKWLRSPLDDIESGCALYAATLPQLKQRWGAILTPSLVKAFDRFGELQPDYYRHCSQGPQTFTHGDYRADNVAFIPNGKHEKAIIFDWQCTRRSRGVPDLAFFMSGSISVAQRRETEPELLQLYFETLLSNGVTGYSKADFERDYRCGLGRSLIIAAVAGGMLDFSSERGRKIISTACERVGAMVDDHDFIGHLEAATGAGSHPVGTASVEKHETYSGGYDPSLLQALARRDTTREAAFFTPWLKPHMHVLDCGCGPGGINLALASLVPQGKVTGVDVEEPQLEMGRSEAHNRGLNNVHFQQASVYSLPFEDSTFDAVLVHAMLYHLGEPAKALQEIRRVLKPGGLIGLRDADIDGDVYFPSNNQLEQFWKLTEQVSNYSGADIRLGRRQRQILRQAGFTEIVASASSDYFGTPESTGRFSNYWGEIYLNQHRHLILENGWATEPELNNLRDTMLAWGKQPDAFYSRCRCEAVARKPAA